MPASIPKFQELFSRLIAAPSVSSLDPAWDQSNRPVADLLACWLEDLGFGVEIIPVSGDPEKVNLLASAGAGGGGLVLSGHTDTVPYDEEAWEQDPFKLREAGNRFYGLGTSDMKCFFPIVLEVLRELDRSKLKQPLLILATCDEESTMAGAKALVSAGRSMGRYALIGEPTGLQPVHMHKGIMLETIKLIGKSGHSSDPDLGINALEGMNTVINNLIQWRTELQSRHQNARFKVPVPTLNFGCIHGGDNPNRICGDCAMQIDIRLLPGMDIENCRASLRRQVMECIDGSGLTVAFDCIFPGLPAMETDVDSDIVKTAEKLSGQASGAVAFGTEGPYLNSLGMQTVVLGPGDIDQAHQANEFLSLDRIEPMKRIVRELIKHYCM